MLFEQVNSSWQLRLTGRLSYYCIYNKPPDLGTQSVFGWKGAEIVDRIAKNTVNACWVNDCERVDWGCDLCFWQMYVKLQLLLCSRCRFILRTLSLRFTIDDLFVATVGYVLLSNIQSSESILQIDLSMRVLHVSFSSFKVIYFVITKLVLFRSRSRTELDHLYFFSNKWFRVYRWNAAFNASIINI